MVCVPCSQYVPIFILFILQSRLKIRLNYLGNSITCCQCGHRGALAVSRPLNSGSWRGAHVPHHTLSPAQTLPLVHFVRMTALCCPWMKRMAKYAKGTQTLSLALPCPNFCCSIAADCSCQWGSTLIRRLQP